MNQIESEIICSMLKLIKKRLSSIEENENCKEFVEEIRDCLDCIEGLTI